MPQNNETIEKLVRLAANGNTTVYAASLDFLTQENIEDYEKQQILVFRGYSDEITCRKCPRQPCTVNPRIVAYPDGVKKGVCNCVNPDEGGRLEFDLHELKYWDINVEKLPRKRRSRIKVDNKPKISREQQKINNRTLLTSTLLHHHRFDAASNNNDELNYEPSTQKQIAEQLNWSQSKVSRILKNSFPAGFWKRYNLACKSDALKGFLKAMDESQVDIEAPTE